MSKIEEIEKLAVSLSLEASSFQKQMTTINKMVQNAERQFKSGAKGVENYEDTFVGLDAKIKKSVKQLDLYETKLSKQREEYEKLKSTLQSQIAKLNDLESTLGKSSEEYKEQAELVQKNSVALTKLSTDIGVTESSIQELNKSLKESKDKMNTLGKEVESLEDKISDNTETFELQQSELKLLASTMDQSKNSFKKMMNEMQQMATQIEKNVQDVQAYEVAINLLEKEISQNISEHMKLAIQIKNVERELDQTKKNYGENSNEATQLSRKLMALKDDSNHLSNEINAQQSEYRQLNTQMNNAQSEANELTRELKKLPFDKLKDDIDKVNEKLNILSGLATGVGGASVAAYGEASNALGKLKGALGETADEADDTLDSVQELAKDGFNFDDALQTMITVKQTMSDLLDDDELEDFTGSVLALTNTFDLDFNDVVKTSSAMMRNFGIKSEKALDIMVYGLQNGLNISGDFLDTLWEYSNQFADLGFTAEDTLEIIAKGMEEGTFNTDKLADMIKEANIRMKEMSDDQKGALKSLGLSVIDVQKNITAGGESAANQMVQVAQKVLEIENPIEQSAIAVELFGTMFEDLGVNGVKALASLGDSTIELDGKTESVKQSFEETFGAEIQAKLQELKEPLIQLAEKGLIPLLDVAGDLITEFTDWFSTLDEGTIESMAQIGLLTMVLGPLASGLSGTIGLSSQLFGWLGNIGGASATTAGATSGLTGALGILGGPIGIGAAILALGGLITWLGDSEQALIWLQDKFGGFGTAISGMCEFISGVIQLTIGNIISWFQLGFDVIGAMIDGPGGATIEDAWANHWARIDANNTDGMQKITLTTTRGMSQMSHVTDESLNEMLNVFEVTMSEIPSVVEEEYGFAALKLAGQLRNMDNTQLTILRGMNDTTGYLFRGIREEMTVSEQTAQIKKNLQDMAAAGKLDTDSFNKDISSAMDTMKSNLSNKSKDATKNVSDNTSQMAKETNEYSKEMSDNVSKNSETMNREVKSDVKDMSNTTKSTVNSMSDSLTTTTGRMANEMISDWNRIRSAYSRSISGNVTINQSKVSRTISAPSERILAYQLNPYLRGVQPISDVNYQTSASYYTAESNQANAIANSKQQNVSFVRELKSLMSELKAKSNDYKFEITIENFNGNNQSDLKKLVDYIDKELKKRSDINKIVKGRVNYA